MKSFTNSGQFKKGQPSPNKGKKASTATRSKQSLAKIGKRLSQETKSKMRGHIPWNKGLTGIKLHNEEVRAKMSALRKGKPIPWINNFGDKNVNWNGGSTKVSKLVRNMPENKAWRAFVFERDNWTCQTCRNRGVLLHAHHIIALSKLLKDFGIKGTKDARICVELWNPENGVTLCEPCHELTDNYKGKAKIK